MLIDHETAFGIRLKFAPRLAPWAIGNLSHMTTAGADSEHVFHRSLAGRRDLALDGIERAWRDLSDARLAAYEAVLPVAWIAARPAVRDVLDHLTGIRDRLPECLAELKRVLT